MGKVWLKAFRLRTLPLALSTIGMGSFVALQNGFFNGWVCLLAVLTTISLQILSNLANDYGDSRHGADSENRIGPKRTVQSGEISKPAMIRMIYVFAILSLAFGVAVSIVAFLSKPGLLLIFVVIGLLAILAAVAYTNGKRPYGYQGLGDMYVFIFFGLTGVAGSYFLYAKSLDWLVLLPATAIGCLSVGVLNINNIRDINSDRAAGKMSIPVRIGKENAVHYHRALLIIAVAAMTSFVLTSNFSPWQWLYLLPGGLIVKNFINVNINRPNENYDPLLKQLALGTFALTAFFGIGTLIGLL